MIAIKSEPKKFWLYFVFISVFFPFPAIPIGNTTGLQIGHMCAVLFLIFNPFWIRQCSSLFLAFSLIVLPSVFSLLFDFSSINFNNTVSFFAAMILLVIGDISTQQRYVIFVRSISFAVIFHSLIGVVQQIWYLNEDFPLLGLYINPSFSTVIDDDNWKIYAYYTKRSFGLFPEPSAMFASISPFLVFLGYKVFTGQFHKWESKRDQLIQTLALFMGGVLVVSGRSGGTPALIVALLPALYIYMQKVWKKPTLMSLMTIFFGCILFIYFGYMALEGVSERFDAEVVAEGSWSERINSIEYGLLSIVSGDFIEMFFGYGLGMVSPLTYAATGASSVHSWIVGYFMGHGIVGVVFFLIFLSISFLSIKKSDSKIQGLSILFVWLVSASVVTGYLQLLSMWIAIGVLLNWDNQVK